MQRSVLPRLIAGLATLAVVILGLFLLDSSGSEQANSVSSELAPAGAADQLLTDSTGPQLRESDTGTLEVEGTEANSGEAGSGDEQGDEAAAAEDGEAIGRSFADRSQGSTAAFEAIRNNQDKFSQYADQPASAIQLDSLLEPAVRPDNGSNGQGQFRVACEYSHFGNDDPIIYPGQPGASHLHMFFGNTNVNAFTTEESLLNSGGGTCSGFELNRSGYWVPALLDGRGNAIVPEQIILYYKSHQPQNVVPMPQGLQMLAGNFDSDSFERSNTLLWSCGKNGHAYNYTNRIPDCGGDMINASIVFPNCWDGVNKTSDDFVSHLATVSEELSCPASHPKRLPQISILIYWPGAGSVDGWHLSSDRTEGFNGPPGGTLHADWWGGWNDDAMNLWINGCMTRARNCSFGQTGTPQQLAQISPLSRYEGEHFLPLPS